MATITYEVTVATGTNWYSANANKYYINGEVAPLLYLQEGNTYIFNQNNASNSGHPLIFINQRRNTSRRCSLHNWSYYNRNTRNFRS
jgi:hypothetical protein